MAFVKATKEKSKLRMALIGIAGSGKTYTSLRVAKNLVPNGKIAGIDTEKGTMKKYSDVFEFDVNEFTTYNPKACTEAIKEAESLGYDVIIIDSLSHFWMGTDGMLDQVDKAAKRKANERGYGNQNNFEAWKDVNPMEKQLWDTLLGCNMHVIVTMRVKTEYVQEKNEKGKTTIRKVGLAPIQRDNLEYEFDVVADLDLDNNLIVGKTRCSKLKGYVAREAGEEIAGILREWLTEGKEADKSAPNDNTSIPEQKKERNYSEEAQNCKTLNDLSDWWKSLTKDEKLKYSHLKDSRKTEIETANVKPNEKGEISKEEIAENLIKNLQKGATELELSAINSLLDNFHKEKQDKWAEVYNKRLKDLGIPFKYEGAPF